MSIENAYWWSPWGDLLYGPDGWCCELNQVADCPWSRDAKPAVVRLNEQHREILALRAENERLRAMCDGITNRDPGDEA